MQSKLRGSRELVRNHEKLYKDFDSKIRVIESPNENKIPVAMRCSEWLNSLARHWGYTTSQDENTRRVCSYLNNNFSECNWEVMPSQKPFDLISLKAGVVIEIKSVIKGSTRVISNASIYPNRLKASDILSPNYDYPPYANEKTVLDVLVICVNRDADLTVHDFAIVDGSYWGFTYNDYKCCNEFYRNFNDPKFFDLVLDIYLFKYSKDTFIQKVKQKKYGNSLNISFRKLITLSNPVGRLNVAGWWKLSEV